MDSPRSPLDEGEIPDDESKEFDDGYDENLMGDEEDKKKLAQMTEKEREQELFDRSERRETLKIRFEIERKLRSKAKKREQEKKQSKQVRRKRLRASEIYSSDESSEESDEYTPDTDKSSALNDINTSGKPTSKMNTRASALLMSSSSESSASSASSSGSDSEPENDDLGGDDDSQTAHDDFQITLDEIRQLQLKREQIERWVYSPFFKETAIGLYVKISIATMTSGQVPKQPVYRVGQIIDITKGEKIYPINTEQAKNRTDKKCLVRIGANERTYDMSYVSNRSIDEDNFKRWKDSMLSDGQNMPSREFFIRKKRDLDRARNYEYKEEDIMYEVAEKRRFKDSPYNFALKKTELMGEKADAEASNDYERARQIQAQIDDLEEKAKQLEKSRSSSTFSAISFVNERNRIKNIEESERVLKESKTIKTEDPFTRRKCTPTIVHNKNNNGDLLNNKQQPSDKDGQDNSTPNGKSNTASNAKNATTKNGITLGKAESLESVSDLYQVHAEIDLDLDI